MTKTKIAVLLIVLPLIIMRCANIKPPTGGPEDTQAPIVKQSYPENNSTNFTGSSVKIEFDEYVDAQKLRENIIISPIMDNAFEVITRKKTVTIKFTKPFLENTTYSINFGESIKDVTKGNYIQNLSLAFSTGPTIDSIVIDGNVIDYLTELPEAGISIQLYEENDTITILNGKPKYFGKTTKKGNFIIRNIKEGTYTICALGDVNNDYKYDQNKERIDYMENVTLKSDSSLLNFNITKEDNKGATIVSRKQEEDYYILSFSEGIKHLHINREDGETIIQLDEKGKKAKLFNTFATTKDTVNYYATLIDSAENTSLDTLKIVFAEVKQKKKRGLTLKLWNETMTKGDKDSIFFMPSSPIRTINADSILIKTDTTINYLTQEDIRTYKQNLGFTITKGLPFKDSLQIEFKNAALISMSGDTLRAKKYTIKKKKPEDFGILGGTIETNEENYIFYLIDGKGKIIDERKDPKKFYYEMLEPGEYKIKIILDKNKNGKWDPINFVSKTKPETIVKYKEKINLRANWEIVDIKLKF